MHVSFSSSAQIESCFSPRVPCVARGEQLATSRWLSRSPAFKLAAPTSLDSSASPTVELTTTFKHLHIQTDLLIDKDKQRQSDQVKVSYQTVSCCRNPRGNWSPVHFDLPVLWNILEKKQSCIIRWPKFSLHVLTDTEFIIVSILMLVHLSEPRRNSRWERWRRKVTHHFVLQRDKNIKTDVETQSDLSWRWRVSICLCKLPPTSWRWAPPFTLLLSQIVNVKFNVDGRFYDSAVMGMFTVYLCVETLPELWKWKLCSSLLWTASEVTADDVRNEFSLFYIKYLNEEEEWFYSSKD